MAVLTYNAKAYTVDHAVKGTDYVHGYDADGNVVVSVEGITDFSLVSYNGTFIDPEKCLEELCNSLKYCDGLIKAIDGREIPPAAVGAALGGYGLGEISYLSGSYTRFTDASKLDDMKVNSFWAYQNSSAPLIPGQPDTQYLYGYTVASGKPYVTQRAVTLYGGSWIERTLGLRNSNGAWSEWKYVNPPMAAGKAYLTTEFFLSKPVYKAVTNLGEYPAGAGSYGIGSDGGMTNNPSMGSGSSGGTTNVISYNLVDLHGTTFTMDYYAPPEIAFTAPASFPGGTVYMVVAYTVT